MLHTWMDSADCRGSLTEHILIYSLFFKDHHFTYGLGYGSTEVEPQLKISELYFMSHEIFIVRVTSTVIVGLKVTAFV